MFLLHALNKRINDLTNQLIALKSVGLIKDETSYYKSILKELHEVTKQREDFYETWYKNFPHR